MPNQSVQQSLYGKSSPSNADSAPAEVSRRHFRKATASAVRHAPTREFLPASDITTKALLQKFSEYQEQRLRQTTFERLAVTLRPLEAHLPRKAKSITRRVVAEYIETRRKTVSAGTVVKEISSLRHCLRLAVTWGLLQENAAARAALPELPPVRTRCLSHAEFQAALETAPSWLRAPMAFAVYTGIRRGEMLALEWSDIDMAQRRAYVHEIRDQRIRIVPLSEDALQVLRSLPLTGSSDRVFAHVDAGRLSVTTRRVFQRLGIMDASLNTLRHTSASWLLQKGVDLQAVGQVLGHKMPHLTQRYAGFLPASSSAPATRSAA